MENNKETEELLDRLMDKTVDVYLKDGTTYGGLLFGYNLNPYDDDLMIFVGLWAIDLEDIVKIERCKGFNRR